MNTSRQTGTGATDAPDIVLGLLREQASLYDRLERLALRQRSLVASADAGALLALLAERQKLSEAMTRLAKRLEPVRRSWSSFRARFLPQQRMEAERLWTDVRDRLRRIITSDEEDARVLSARKRSVAKTLSDAHVTGTAISAYRVPAASATRLDHLDEGV